MHRISFSSHGLLLTLLVVLSLLTSWLNLKTTLLTDLTSPITHLPDWTTDRLRAHIYDADGHLTTQLAAKQLVHTPDDNIIHFDDIKLVYWPADHTLPWQGSAEHAVLFDKQKKLELRGAVQLQQTEPNSTRTTQIQTEHIMIEGDTEEAFTDQRVSITHHQNTLTGVGARFNNRTRQLSIYTHVQAIHNP